MMGRDKPCDVAFWLMKSEPDAYGIDDLRREGNTLWDGIRNYQARNFMRTMEAGDRAFFYHSNCKPPGIIGLMEVMETSLVDPTQFDPTAKYTTPNQPLKNHAGTAHACDFWRNSTLCSASTSCVSSTAKSSCP